jgi:DHA1 family tetracycline resistance protein-like MFS transporter
MWKLPRALIPVYGTTLADTLGYTLMIPLLPQVVGQYHVSDVTVGALLSVPACLSMLTAPLWGKLGDRAGRKPVVMASQAFSLAGYLLLATSHSLVWIFAARIVSGFGGGGLGAVQSLIADITEERDRDLAFSLYGAVFGLAFVIGPACGGFLAQRGFATPFFIAAGIELCNLAFTASFLPSLPAGVKTSIGASLAAAAEPGVRRVLVRQFLAIFAIVCFLSTFGLFLHHVLDASARSVSWLLAVAGVTGGIALICIVAPLAQRIGDRYVAQIGLALSFAAYALLAFVRALPLFFVALALWAVGSAMVEPTLAALLSIRAKREERGAIMGLSDSTTSLAMVLGPVAGSAFLGINARYVGVLPALAALAAFLIGRLSRPARP